MWNRNIVLISIHLPGLSFYFVSRIVILHILDCIHDFAVLIVDSLYIVSSILEVESFDLEVLFGS